MFRLKIAAAGILLAVLAAVVCPNLTLAQSTPAGTGTADGGPSVFLPVKVYEFNPVIDGANVVYDFVVQNKGNEPLLISNVRTG
jgi:hypothetical protein